LFEEKFVLGEEEMENLIYMGEMGLPHFNMDDNGLATFLCIELMAKFSRNPNEVKYYWMYNNREMS
jgi:hypothetical protein